MQKHNYYPTYYYSLYFIYLIFYPKSQFMQDNQHFYLSCIPCVFYIKPQPDGIFVSSV